MANARHKPKPDAARTLVLELLNEVSEAGAYANLRLPEMLSNSSLDERDRAFVTELAYGTLRMQGKHDAFIKAKSNRPIEDLDFSLRNLLRMGLHQLNEMRVPDHAAVGETVEIARATLGEAKASFVNAMLRECTRTPEFYSQYIIHEGDSATVVRSKLSILHSHPEWEVQSFYDQFKDWSRVESLLIANNTPVKPHLIAWPGRSTVEELMEGQAQRIHGTSFGVYSTRPPRSYNAVVERRAGVQDAGSQIISEVFFNTHSIGGKRSLSWLDMCAGPGGKAAALYSLISFEREEDAFKANELQQHRADLVAQVIPQNLVSVGPGQEISERYDRIIIDAPCTGLGALRRRPEARWRRSQEDLKELVHIQKDLLHHGAQILNPGGVLAYVTCSPHLLETKAQVLELMHKNPQLDQLNISEYLPKGSSLDSINSDGTLQLWSDRDGTDSMFMAMFKKSEA